MTILGWTSSSTRIDAHERRPSCTVIFGTPTSRSAPPVAASRADALRNTAFVVSHALERVEETNLLALNATIKAARAGRGAPWSPARSKIAQDTARATENVGRLITAIQTMISGVLTEQAAVTRELTGDAGRS